MPCFLGSWYILDEIETVDLYICSVTFSFPALITGVVVTFLVVVALLSLVGGMVVVVLRARRKKMMDAGQYHSKPEDNPHKREDNKIMYQNVQNEQTPVLGHNEPDYATAADAFINPASATASLKTHMDDYEMDQWPADMAGGGVYEEARIEWGGRGCFEKLKGPSREQKKSAAKMNADTKVKPEDLYAEPNKGKKHAKTGSQKINRNEEAAALPHALYAQPDLTKKRNQKGQQDVEHERKLPLQAPLPYKKRKEARHEGDVPETPPPYVPDEEQHCNTGDVELRAFLLRKGVWLCRVGVAKEIRTSQLSEIMKYELSFHIHMQNSVIMQVDKELSGQLIKCVWENMIYLATVMKSAPFCFHLCAITDELLLETLYKEAECSLHTYVDVY